MFESQSPQQNRGEENKQIVNYQNSGSHLQEENKQPQRQINEQTQRSSHNKDQQTKTKGLELYFPQTLKRELLRLVFIPLLIILFLLTIALTFKQNNYQTNDYFYSKNIQINRKIRGIVPPLNETKTDIFGQYRIGLVQSFNVLDRRMMQGFKVEMWRNQTLKISQVANEDKCWSVYKLKFYSSTIFIEKLQAHLANFTPKVQNKTSEKVLNQVPQNKQDQQESKQVIIERKGTQQIPSKDSLKQVNTQTENQIINPTQISKDAKSSQLSEKQIPQTSSQNQKQQPLCQVDKWSKLNQILCNSHIWTFAQGNFYIMQFSQTSDDNTGVLIMRMLTQYPNTA